MFEFESQFSSKDLIYELYRDKTNKMQGQIQDFWIGGSDIKKEGFELANLPKFS